MKAAAAATPRGPDGSSTRRASPAGSAHPSIVPVHAMGLLPDGRPYFAMKLVEGETLAVLLQERPDTAGRRMEMVRIFTQVCQAVAYAHARGVIHRDLKPANVMVGAFGEVQVMDWGLAKEMRNGRRRT